MGENTIKTSRGLESLALMSCRSPYVDDERVYPPLGLLYLKSYVNQEMPNVDVKLMDDYEFTEEQFKQYDAIGVSIMTPQREEAKKILKYVKEKFPEKTIIAGGPHVFHYRDEVTSELWDYVVPKDGQRSLVKILRGNAERVEFDVFSKQEYASMPRPDRSSLEAKLMLQKYHYNLGGKKAATAFFAQGCPEQCTFCEESETAVKWSSIDNIKGELQDIKKLGYEGIYIFDDIFAIALPKIRPICEELDKQNLIYRCNSQSRYFTKWGEDMAKLLSSTGCYEIAAGFETGSQKILDNIKKRTTIEQNYQTVEFAKKHGIKVKGFMMLGLPGETRETVKQTEAFIRDSGIDDFQLSIYFPYKGTKIRDAIDRGNTSMDLYIVDEGLGAYGQKGGNTECVVRTDALSRDELLELRDEIVKKYKPESHRNKWKNEDGFFDTHLVTGGD